MAELARKIHPLVPVAKAARLLRLDENLLISRISRGVIAGECRRIDSTSSDTTKPGSRKKRSTTTGYQEQWFIHADEFDRLLDDKLANLEERVTTSGMDDFFTTNFDATPTYDFAPPRQYPEMSFVPGHDESVDTHPHRIATDRARDHVHISESDLRPSDSSDDHQAIDAEMDAQCATKSQTTSAQEFVATTFNTELSKTIGTAIAAEIIGMLSQEVERNQTLHDRIDSLEREIVALKTELYYQVDSKPTVVSRVGGYFARMFGLKMK
jgi:hypothetical protein